MASGFDEVVALLDYPVYVVTAAVGDERTGCLVGFATQASIDPARFLVGVSVANHTAKVIARADRLAVHVLSSANRDLAALFGEQTGDEVDKFSRCEWQSGPDGEPILAEAAAWFSGPIIDRHPLGDHTGYLIAPDRSNVRQPDARRLMLSDVDDLEAGHDA